LTCAITWPASTTLRMTSLPIQGHTGHCRYGVLSVFLVGHVTDMCVFACFRPVPYTRIAAHDSTFPGFMPIVPEGVNGGP
jgi:hypothetical protein